MRQPPVSRAAMAIAIAVSWGSMLIHNQYELPISVVDAENTGPLVVALALLGAYAIWPTYRPVSVLILGWAALNFVVGGILTVLPLPFLPFEPEQSVTHYAMHVIYSLGQVPLLVAGWAARRGSRPPAESQSTD